MKKERIKEELTTVTKWRIKWNDNRKIEHWMTCAGKKGSYEENIERKEEIQDRGQGGRKEGRKKYKETTKFW